MKDQTRAAGKPQPVAYSYTRFSTTKQADGSSRERQARMAQDWCERNGYSLSDDTFEDLGVSAFKGRNREIGALGVFVDAARQGLFPKGTVLLIENADRLSRAGIWASVSLLKEITEAGIDIVFLTSNHRVSRGSLDNLNDMVRIIVEAERSAEESRRKSDIISRMWTIKREKVAREGKRLTGLLPGWIESKGDNGFKIKPEQAKVIRRIFQERAAGAGPDKIARGLNRRGVPTFRYGKKWTRGTIQKLLESKAAIGTLRYGPGTDPSTKAEIEGYYPAVITRKLWQEARAMKPETPRGGRGNSKIRTPFGRGLARCGACGASMGATHTRPTGYGHKGDREYTQMVCSSRRIGKPCKGETVSRGKRGRRMASSVPVGEMVTALKLELPRVLDEAPNVEAGLTAQLRAAEDHAENIRVALDNILEPAGAEPGEDYKTATSEAITKLARKLTVARADLDTLRAQADENAGPLVRARFDRIRAAIEPANTDMEELGAALRGIFKHMVFDWRTEWWTAEWRHAAGEKVEFPATMRALGLE